MTTRGCREGLKRIPNRSPTFFHLASSFTSLSSLGKLSKSAPSLLCGESQIKLTQKRIFERKNLIICVQLNCRIMMLQSAHPEILSKLHHSPNTSRFKTLLSEFCLQLCRHVDTICFPYSAR